MATAKRKPRQQTLKIKDKKDAVAKAAQKYMNARTVMQEAKEDADVAAGELVKIMRAKRRKTINLGNVIVTLKHVEAQDALAIKKVKQPQK